MRTKCFICILTLAICTGALAWEPSQASARKIALEYDLFPPFGNTEINVKVGDDGYIEILSIATNHRMISIPAKDLKSFRYPSLADIEIMHYEEKDDESGLGGTFSLCIPYGHIKRVENEEYWQRPVLAVLVTPTEERIRDIPLSENNVHHVEPNGCEISAQEIYGF